MSTRCLIPFARIRGFDTSWRGSACRRDWKRAIVGDERRPQQDPDELVSACAHRKSRSGESRAAQEELPPRRAGEHSIYRYLLGLALAEDAVVGHDRHSVDLFATFHDDEPDWEGEESGTDVVGDESDTVLIQCERPGGLQADLDTADVLEERRRT